MHNNADQPEPLNYAPRPVPKRRHISDARKSIAILVLVIAFVLFLWGLFIPPGPGRFDLWASSSSLFLIGLLIRFL